MYNVCNRHFIFTLEKKIMHEYIYWRVWTSYGHNECWKKMGPKSLIKFQPVISKMGCHWPQKQVLLESLRVNATFYTAHITKARATSSCNNSNLMQTFERLQGNWQRVVEKKRIRFVYILKRMVRFFLKSGGYGNLVYHQIYKIFFPWLICSECHDHQ